MPARFNFERGKEVACDSKKNEVWQQEERSVTARRTKWGSKKNEVWQQEERSVTARRTKCGSKKNEVWQQKERNVIVNTVFKGYDG